MKRLQVTLPTNSACSLETFTLLFTCKISWDWPQITRHILSVRKSETYPGPAEQMKQMKCWISSFTFCYERRR